jgi:hypothetical protein
VTVVQPRTGDWARKARATLYSADGSRRHHPRSRFQERYVLDSHHTMIGRPSGYRFHGTARRFGVDRQEGLIENDRWQLPITGGAKIHFINPGDKTSTLICLQRSATMA